MSVRRFGCLLSALLVAMVSLAGCGGGVEPAGNTISGTVTFKGQPLDQGSIEFTPTSGQTTMSGATITNGAYTIPAESGLDAGTYQVRISSVEGGAAPTDEPPGEPTATAKQRIPAEYNSKSTLTAEVKDEGENTFDFDIK